MDGAKLRRSIFSMRRHHRAAYIARGKLRIGRRLRLTELGPSVPLTFLDEVDRALPGWD